MAEVSCTEIWSWTTSCWIKTAISRSRTLECAKKVSTETRLPRRSAEHPITSHRKLVFRFFLTKAIATYTAYYIYIYILYVHRIYTRIRDSYRFVCSFIADYIVSTIRKVGWLVGIRRTVVRNVGWSAAVRRRRRRGTVRRDYGA